MEYLDDVRAAVRLLIDAQPAISRYRAYYDGDHRMEYATGRTEKRYGQLFQGFKDNMCRAVVQASASRLSVTGVNTGEKASTQAVLDLLKASNFDWIQARAHEDALVTGESFLVAWDDGKGGGAKLYHNGAGLIWPVYESLGDRTMRLAVKMWRDGSTVMDPQRAPVRMTIYYPDRAERYIGSPNATDPASFRPYSDDGEPEVQPHKFGVVPVVHFDAQRSDIADAIPLQDALNKSGYDTLVGQEFTSLAQRFVTGIDVGYTDGEPDLKWEKGSLWWSESPDTTFGQLPGGDLTGMLAAGDSWRLAIARVTRTPLHYLIQRGDFPSGEALRVAEAPFSAKVSSLQGDLGEGWEKAAGLLLGVEDWSAFEAIWEDLRPLDESSKWETALAKRAVGLSTRQVLREMGYSDDDITKIAVERSAEDESKAQTLFRGPTTGRPGETGQSA